MNHLSGKAKHMLLAAKYKIIDNRPFLWWILIHTRLGLSPPLLPGVDIYIGRCATEEHTELDAI